MIKAYWVAGVLLLFCGSLQAANDVTLLNKKWVHGSKDCAKNTDPALDVLEVDKATYIIRQNKCHSYEAPFIYLLIGTQQALVVDTGAVEDASIAPVYKKVRELLGRHDETERDEALTDDMQDILVLHTHGHSDHKAGDVQFLNKPNTKVLPVEKEALIQELGFKNWPEKTVDLDLGERKITLIPTPGHSPAGITLYDSRSKWLLTGDTFYPGLLYVRDWEMYRQSINRLALFIESKEVSYILGNHIEMTAESGKLYPIGTVYQPNESPLPLNKEDLLALNKALQASEAAEELSFDRFIVRPMSAVQKTLVKVLSWFF